MIVKEIPLNKILVDKNNPRSVVEEVDELAQSIQQHGQFHPADTEDLGNGSFLLQNGHRRYNAKLKIQKDTKTPQTLTCIVHQRLSDEDRLIKQAQIDSQSKSLTPKDRDALWAKLYDKKYTDKEFAKLVGSNPTSVNDFIDRLLLPKHLKGIDVSQSVIKETKILDTKVRAKVMKHVQDTGMGRAALRRVVQSIKHAPSNVVDAYVKGKIDGEDVERLKDMAPERAEVGIQAIHRMKKDIKSVPKALATAKMDDVTRKKYLNAQQFIKRLQDEIVQTITQMDRINGVLDKIETEKLDQYFDARMKMSLVKYLTEMNDKIQVAVKQIEISTDRWR